MRRALGWSLLCVLLLSALPALADDFFFRNGDDPIVFLGDSITEQRMYTAYIEAYVLTRFPEWNVRFRNIGWGGDTSWLSKRGSFDNGLKRDILSLKPAAITIDFGMNDARGGDSNLAQYVKYQTLLAQALRDSGARVALVTPSPEERDEAGQPGGSGYNNMLWKYSQALKQVAADQGVKFVDQYTGFVKVIEDGRAAKLPNFILIPDHVHPNWAGHLIMAHQILKGLGAPSLVSRATVDAGSGLCPKAEKCIISNVKMDGDVLSFTRLDDCLPMPVRGDSAMVFSVPGYDFLDDLNRYEVAVTGLRPGNYDLAIDGERIATYTAEQLAVGANIALTAGAITRQGLDLLSTVLDKNNVYFNRWRNVQVFDFPYWAKTDQNEELRGKELARLDGDIADREAKINALRKPVPHVFSIKPVP
jgi:lysophospholipase L1-like esterase